MSEQVTWLFAFVAIYLAYCLYWGVTSARQSVSPGEFFLADRDVSPWPFVLVASALSLTGWVSLGHPSMIYLDGFQFAQLALAAIVIPLGGILFLKRQWMLGKRYGYMTPGEMLSDYYSGEAVRVVVIVVALVFAIPFAGMQLVASGRLIQGLTGGLVDANTAMWVLSFSVFLYACLGGWRAVTAAGALQALLIGAGMIGLGALAYYLLGGFGTFVQNLAKLGTASGGARYLAIPGVVQFTEGLGKETPVGGVWTAAMILSYAFALAGLQSSPAFSILGFSCRDVRGFAAQQVWVTGAAIGVVTLFFAVPEGMGAHFLDLLGGAPSAAALGRLGAASHLDLTEGYLNWLARQHPWFMALLAVSALGAIHVAAAAFASAASTIVAYDVFKRYMYPAATERTLKLCARIALAVIFLIALVLSTFAPSVQSQLGTLALGFGLQLWPALVGLCWYSWITRQGATLGAIAGMIAVVFTEPIGNAITQVLGFELPWGRWPWTIHSAGWGIFFNLLICIPVSLATFRREHRLHRFLYHDFFRQYAALTPRKTLMRPAVWALTLVWFFFALGPGAVIGNDLFGAPNGGLSAWILGIPSLWAWQVIWWSLGVLVIWWLAYKMEFSTAPHREVKESSTPAAGQFRSDYRRPAWIRNFLRRVT